MVFSVVEHAQARFPELVIRERSLAEHPDLGPRYGVTSAPAIVVNGRLEFRTVPGYDIFLQRLVAIAKADGH